MFRTLVSQGKIKEVFHLINQDAMLQDLGCIREYSLAALIYKAEIEYQTDFKVNVDILEENELISQLQRLRFLLKRVEFHCDDRDSAIKVIINNYSVYAIYYTIIYFIRYRKDVLYNIYRYYQEAQMTEESNLIHKMMEVTQDNISVER